MNPTKKQTIVLNALRRASQFNNFDPEDVHDVLMENLGLWGDGIYDPEKDDATLYLYPRKGKEQKLEVMAHRQLAADEVDYMPLYDYDAYPKEKKIATGGLRIWWD